MAIEFLTIREPKKKNVYYTHCTSCHLTNQFEYHFIEIAYIFLLNFLKCKIVSPSYL